MSHYTNFKIYILNISTLIPIVILRCWKQRADPSITILSSDFPILSAKPSALKLSIQIEDIQIARGGARIRYSTRLFLQHP